MLFITYKNMCKDAEEVLVPVGNLVALSHRSEGGVANFELFYEEEFEKALAKLEQKMGLPAGEIFDGCPKTLRHDMRY